MKKKKVTVKKILSTSTVEKLSDALNKGNMENLKKQMEKLFTFKNVFSMHDDHIIELAECIVDLVETDNVTETAANMEQYARTCMSRYIKKRKELSRKIQWAKTKKNVSKLDLLDLQYELWVYEEGVEYSHFHMYSTLCQIIREMRECGKEDTQ